MTTITKERLLTIKQWRETYGPGSNVVLPAEEAEELARIALASMEAKPIGAFHIAEQQVDGTSDYLKDGEWPIDNGIIEVYAAPPVPVVPEEKPMPNALSMLEREITQLIGDAQEATVTGYELIAEAWRLMDGQDPKTSDWHSKASKYLNSNIVEKVDDDRIEAVEAVKAVLRRLAGNSPVIPGDVLSAILKVARVRADFDDFDGDRRGIGDCLDEAEQELIVTINKHASQLAAKPPQEEKSGNADCTATSGKTDNPQASGKQVEELTMLVKRLASSLKSVNKSSKLPDKAMDYLLRNGLVSVEGRGR
ncbi:hypothetical protein B6P79_004345 [Escherichia coli]|nr:hypothetical protein [Escherichia coli]EIW5410094.1 hypothetical protein [Escherichia coli]